MLFLFNLFHVITTFYVPLTIVVLCYTLIGLSLRRQMAQRKTLHDEKRYAMMCATRIRFVRASVAIIATFLLTWMPYQVGYLRASESCRFIVRYPHVFD